MGKTETSKCMTKRFLVLSISDVITNSSSEVFLFKANESLKELEKAFPDVDFEYLRTEEEVKDFVFSLLKYDEYDRLTSKILPTVPDWFIYDLPRYLETFQISDDTAWELIKFPYLSLIGKVIVDVHNTNPYIKSLEAYADKHNDTYDKI